jgi:nanoRNase/pAp phosphatase (c-di-AMP/oligoRNAs hydrolase)
MKKMKEKIIQFDEILKKSKKILLINHIRMDPDAFS